MDITPEMFKANAIVKAFIVGIFAVPVLFIFPLYARNSVHGRFSL